MQPLVCASHTRAGAAEAPEGTHTHSFPGKVIELFSFSSEEKAPSIERMYSQDLGIVTWASWRDGLYFITVIRNSVASYLILVKTSADLEDALSRQVIKLMLVLGERPWFLPTWASLLLPARVPNMTNDSPQSE